MATRSNPSLFGQDLVDVGWRALGLAGSGAIADKFVWPAVRNVAPGQGAASQIAHGAATFVSALLLGQGVRMLGQRGIGKNLTEGGAILGVGEAIASVVPGFSVSGSFPTSFQLRKAEAVVQLPPGGTNTPALPASSARPYSGI